MPSDLPPYTVPPETYVSQRTVRSMPLEETQVGVTDYRDFRRTANSTYSSDTALGVTTFVQPHTAADRVFSTSTELSQIYPESGEPQQLHAMLSLLSRFIEHASEAQAELKRGTAYESGIALQHAQSLLPELYCFREIGPGYSGIISAIDTAFRNKAGEFFTHQELDALIRVVGFLRIEPFSSHDRAVDEIILLEESGLDVDAHFLGDALED